LLLFLIAVALGTLPLVSPLDEVGDSYLLSGHMLQHVLIGDAAPALALVALRGPLLFFLIPAAVLAPLARLHTLRRLLAFLLHPVTSLAVWMLVIAGWHVPVAYDYALRNQTVHDLEHLSFIVAGLFVWMQIVDPARRRHLSLTQRLGRQGPALELDALDGDHLVGVPAAVVAAEAPHRARERGADEALLGVGVVEPAHLERDQARLAEIDGLLEPPLGQVPEMELAAVAASGDVVE